MKIIYFCNIAPKRIGAFEVLLAELCVTIKGMGGDFVIVTGGEPTEEVKRCWTSRGAIWDVLNGWTDENGVERGWKFSLAAPKFLKQHKPDLAVVHFGNESPALVASLITKLTFRKKPKWLWIQAQQIKYANFLGRRISKIKLLSFVFEKLVTQYEGGQKSLLERGIKKEKTIVIHNGTKEHISSRVSGWLRKDLKLDESSIIITTVASLIKRKRLDFAIRAIELLGRTTEEKFNFVICGDGPEASNLEHLVKDKGLEDKVFFLGTRGDVRDIMKESDVFILTSRAEACANVINEAMEAGLPCVVTDAGAAREQIADGVSGYVIEPNDHSDFVQKLKLFIESPRIREEMGMSSRIRWDKHFRLENAARKYVELFREIHREQGCVS